jgi:hypothetical protein
VQPDGSDSVIRRLRLIAPFAETLYRLAILLVHQPKEGNCYGNFQEAT